MKKLLALVLALVMSMSLVTISNAAFKDADKIDYKEAVDVMNAVGVFVGDEKGNFNAKDNLTREQAAKIIAYLELGSKAADVLVGGATFTDVASSRWSAGFVGYCAQAGVVSGYDGKFDPAGQLTALQFGKMLLVEIGYDAKAAGMTGTDWAINTSKLMATTGLMKGIDGSVNQVLTREKAAQMTLNALKTPTVEYATKGSSVTVNGAEINFGASVPTYVTNTIAKEQTISKDKLTNSGEYTIELGEKLYKDLKLVKDTTDAFERPTHEWYLKTTKIGAYAEAADLEYTATVKTGTIYSDLGLSKGIDDSKVTYFVDGMDLSTSWNWDIVKGDITNKVGGNGAQTFVYYDDDAKSVKVVVVNTYVAKVAAAYPATTTKDAYVNLDNTVNTGAGATFETDEFAKDDIVIYTYSYKAGDVGVQSMAKPEAVTGKLSAFTDNTSVSVDGTVYKKSATGVIAGFNNSLEKDVTVYLDDYGYAIYVDADATVQYAVVLAYQPNNTLDSARAKLMFTDGTVEVVNVKKLNTLNPSNVVIDGSWDGDDYETSVTPGTPGTPGVVNTTLNQNDDLNEFDIVSYKVDSNNKYTLTLAGDASDAAIGFAKITKGLPTLNLISGNNYNVNDSGLLVANGKTIFMVIDETGSETTYSVYTGIANVPTIEWKGGTYSAPVAVVSENNATAKVVMVVKTNIATVTNNLAIAGSNKDITFIKGNHDNSTYVPSLGYYEYDCITNGVEGKIKTASAVTVPTLVSGIYFNEKEVATGWSQYSAYDVVNDTSIYNASADVKVAKATEAYANEVVKLGGTYYTFDEDAKVYSINTAGEVTEISYKSISDRANDIIWFVLKDGVITTAYVQVVDAPEPIGSGAGKLSSAVLWKSGTHLAVTVNTSAALDTSSSKNVKIVVEQYMTATDKWISVYTGNVTIAANATTGANTSVVASPADNNIYRVTATYDGGTVTSNNFIW